MKNTRRYSDNYLSARHRAATYAKEANFEMAKRELKRAAHAAICGEWFYLLSEVADELKTIKEAAEFAEAC